jgi:hypothetical protein
LEEIGDSLFNLCKADKMLGGERFWYSLAFLLTSICI